MTDYKIMAINAIRNNPDLQGWKTDLADTCQFALAETLVDVMAGIEIPERDLYLLWAYMGHIERAGN